MLWWVWKGVDKTKNFSGIFICEKLLLFLFIYLSSLIIFTPVRFCNIFHLETSEGKHKAHSFTSGSLIHTHIQREGESLSACLLLSAYIWVAYENKLGCRCFNNIIWCMLPFFFYLSNSTRRGFPMDCESNCCLLQRFIIF